MQAVILAAGLGSRILPITSLIPKCLIKVNGETIIERQVRSLLENNIDEIIVVVGYLQHKIRRVLRDTVTYIENPIFRDSNSSYSLWLAKESVKEGFVYLNCDLIFDKRIAKKLLGSKSENAMMIDKRVNGKSDMFKAELNGNRIIRLDKKLAPNECDAEVPGPAKFSREGARRVFMKLDEHIANGDKSQWCYTIFSEIAEGIDLVGIDVERLPWVEVDSLEDLEEARRIKLDTEYQVIEK